MLIELSFLHVAVAAARARQSARCPRAMTYLIITSQWLIQVDDSYDQRINHELARALRRRALHVWERVTIALVTSTCQYGGIDVVVKRHVSCSLSFNKVTFTHDVMLAGLLLKMQNCFAKCSKWSLNLFCAPTNWGPIIPRISVIPVLSFFVLVVFMWFRCAIPTKH